MTDTNYVALSGRLVREPKLYSNGNSKRMALFTLASNRQFKSREGDPQKETAYVPCKAIGAWTDELDGRQKGEMFLVTGKLVTESWEKNGKMNYQLTLICQTVQAVMPAPKSGAVAKPKADDEAGDDDNAVPF
jgi:single-strand DNA-binding protein